MYLDPFKYPLFKENSQNNIQTLQRNLHSICPKRRKSDVKTSGKQRWESENCNAAGYQADKSYQRVLGYDSIVVSISLVTSY